MTTESIKPWEPVSYSWPRVGGRAISDPIVWSADAFFCSMIDPGDALRVTLANGQTIIVRAMSERRKADRRTRDSRGMTAAERFQWKGG